MPDVSRVSSTFAKVMDCICIIIVLTKNELHSAVLEGTFQGHYPIYTTVQIFTSSF